MSSRVIALALALASFTGVAAAQTYTCTAAPGSKPIRGEGIAEYISDIVVYCPNTNYNPYAGTHAVTVTLNANITSRLDQNNTSEATLLLDEAVGDSRSEGYTIFRGVQTSPNSVTFSFIPVFGFGNSGYRTFRFSNIRVDVSQLPPGTPIQADISTVEDQGPLFDTASVSRKATGVKKAGIGAIPVDVITAAIVQPRQGFAVRTCDDSQSTFTNFLQSPSQNAGLANGSSATGNIQFNVRFAESFSSAFRKRIASGQDPSAPGVDYYTESGAVDTGVLGPVPGVATQGTRLISRFNSIPAGVRLFVTTLPLGPGGASSTGLAANLISVDANGAGSPNEAPNSAIGVCAATGASQFISELPIVNGSAQAVWEVTNSIPTELEKVSFGVAIAYVSSPLGTSPGLGTVNVRGGLGPLSTVLTPSDTAPAPRFAASTVNIPAFAIGSTSANSLTITTASPLPGGQAGFVYTLPSFVASGGTPAYAWSAAQGSTLPPGLTLLTNGTFSGTPTSAGSYSFNIQVSDQAGGLATKAFSLTIASAGSLTITTASPLPGGQVTVAYSLPSFAATGGTAPYTWTLAGTAPLPPGLTLVANGNFSGTPTAVGTYAFAVRVTDQLGVFVSKAFQITISTSGTGGTGGSITTASPLPPGTVGTVYSPVQFAVTGFSLPVTWGVSSSGSPLPPGLTFSSAGVLAGTPTAQGTYSFDIRVSNSFLQQAIKNFTITINPGATAPTITISPATLPTGVTGTAYSQLLTATGGIAPYTFSLGSGSLPLGLTLSPGGLVSGTLLSQGSSLFSIVATDVESRTGSQAYGVSVVLPTTPNTDNNPLSITTRSLPNGMAGADYAASLGATGGVTPYVFSADLQTLPPGVSVSALGVFSGKPTRGGNFRVSVKVTDARGSSDGTVLPLTITGPPLSITTTTLGNGSVGIAYAGSVQATGGIQPYVFGLASGSLPAGLSLGSDGSISGTPTAPGAGTFTVQVTDAAVNPQGLATRSFTITVLANPPMITTTALGNGAIGIAYSGSVAATGGVLPYTFSVSSGALPAGLALAADGTISGTPTAIGDFSVTIQVTDKQKLTDSKSFPLKIVAPPSITTNSPLGIQVVGTASQLTLAATGGTPPFTWSVSGGSLPAGLSLNAGSGAITGTPTAAGTFSFAATVTDANKLTATKSFTGRVTTPVRITTASPLAPATVGTAYSAKIDATGGTVPYRFGADTLPAGLAIDTAGNISGTPTIAGAGAFTATVSDADALTASARFTIAVALPQLSGVTIGGVTDTPPPAQQQNVTVVLGTPFPVALTGTVTLTFLSDANVPIDDPAIQFSTGGRSAAFTIPAGNTQATFTAPNPAIQTGTVSGTITLTTSLQAGGTPVICNCTLTRTIRVAKGPPVISSVRAVRSAGTITITIIGFSTSREMTQAAFQFTTAAGANVTTTSFTVPVSTFFTTWYTSTQSAPFGSQFLMTQPFTVSGDVNAITNVSVTLANAVGTSTAVSAAVQ